MMSWSPGEIVLNADALPLTTDCQRLPPLLQLMMMKSSRMHVTTLLYLQPVNQRLNYDEKYDTELAIIMDSGPPHPNTD